MNAQRRAGSLRILIYLFPALIDMVVAQFLFINTVRIAKMGASAAVGAGVTTVWSLAYLIACFTAGRLATPRNSATWMLVSCGSLAVLALLSIFVPGVVGIYVVTGLSGAAAALFFPPFQTFMKAVDQGASKSLAYSTGLYTFSWSAGYAVGPLVSGFLMELGPNGWQLALAFGACASVLTAIGIVYLRHLVPRAQTVPIAAAVPASPSPPAESARLPDLAWLAWIGAGVGMIAISVIRAVFPSHAIAALQIGDGRLGMLFFLLSMTQACTGLALCRSRVWMYRALPVCAVGCLGAIAMACFAVGTSMALLAAGAILFGVYSGSFFFYLVFHAIAHPVRIALYVAINESVVGVSGIVGPLIGGLLSDRFGFVVGALVAAAAIVAVSAFQAVIHRRHPVS